MAEATQCTLWLSGSEEEPELTQRIRAALAGVDVDLRHATGLLPGSDVPSLLAQEVQQAAGFVFLLSPDTLLSAWDREGPSLLARCRKRPCFLVLIRVRPCVTPDELAAFMEQNPHCRLLPRNGVSMSEQPSSKQEATLDELRRSVAAALGFSPPRDGQFEALQRYRQTLSKQLETFSVRGLFGAQHQAQAQAMPMVKMFVPLRLAWQQSPPEVRQEIHRITALLKSNEKLTPETRWEQEQRLDELQRRFSAETSYRTAEIIGEHPQLMILGVPGSGKTSLLGYIAREQAQDPWSLPILVSMQSLAPKARKGESLWQPLLRWIRSEYGALVAEAFGEWSEAGRALVLLDGLDEVASEQRHSLLDAVERMLVQRARLRCIVTSRPGPDCWLDARVPHFRILDLGESEIASFVRQHHETEDPVAAEAHASRLLSAIGASRDLRSLARNPLTLRLLCMLDTQKAGLPTRRDEVYDRAIETLIRTWPAARLSRRAKVTPEALRQALAGLACWQHEHGRRTVSRKELLCELGRNLPGVKSKTRAQLAEYCVATATEHAGILIEQSPDTFAFLHLTFMEYLAAEHYIRTNQLSVLLTRRADGRYSQVIRFAAGALTQAVTSPDLADSFVRQLAEERPGTPEQVRHPWFPLALQCMGDGQGLSPQLQEQLLCGLLRAVTLPLAHLIDPVIVALHQVIIPQSSGMLAAVALLIHHPLVSVRRAVSGFLLRGAPDSAQRRELWCELLDDSDTVVRGRAATALLRCGLLKSQASFRILLGLAACFHPEVDSLEEVSAALQTEPSLCSLVERYHQSRYPDTRRLAARILSLRQPGDWTVIAPLLVARDAETTQALYRAALQSPDTARLLVEAYLSGGRSNPYERSEGEEALTLLFACCDTVRRQLVESFCQAPPAALNPKDNRHTPTQRAAGLLVELGRKEAKQSANRTILLTELRLHIDPLVPMRCARIAELVAQLEAPADLLADALRPCIQDQGGSQLWAIEVAARHRLYDLAMAGMLDRIQRPECAAGAIAELCAWAMEPAARNSILDALAAASPSPLLADVTRLCRVAAAKESSSSLYDLLQEEPDPARLAICWAAARLLIPRLRRDHLSVPTRVLGTLLAMTCVKWPAPSDTPRDSVGRRLGLTEIISARLLFSQPSRPVEPEAFAALQRTFDWLPISSGGSTYELFRAAEAADWIFSVLASSAERVDYLLRAYFGEDPQRSAFAQWLIEHCLERQATLADGREADSDQSRACHVVYEHLQERLTKSPGEAGWRLACLFVLHGPATKEACSVIAAYTAPDHELARRWAAMTLLPAATLTEDAHKSVLLAALQSDNLPLRLEAVDWAKERPEYHQALADALFPLLEGDCTTETKFAAAVLWLMLPQVDVGLAARGLLPALKLLTPASPWLRFCSRQTLRHLLAQPSEEARLGRHTLAFEPSGIDAPLGQWAAAILAELGGHEEELRSALAGWLDSLPEPAQASRLDETGRALRDQALSILAKLGVGGARDSVERTLVGLCAEESERAIPTNAFHFMRELNFISRKTLEGLLPAIIRNERDPERDIYNWVFERVAQSASVHADLSVLLLDSIQRRDSTASYYHWNVLAMLFSLGFIDESVADFFIEYARNDCPEYAPEPIQHLNIPHHPVVYGRILARLATGDPEDAVRLVDWLVPIKDLLGEPSAKVMPPSAATLAVLRGWLDHMDYGLRIEAAERLLRLGCKEPAVVASLHSCLSTPLDWSGAYFGFSARRQAAELLWQFDRIAPQELLASLLPILDLPNNLPNNRSTVTFLGSIAECRASMLSHLEPVLLKTSGDELGYWETLRVAIGLGLPADSQRALLLHFLAETSSYCEDAIQVLAQLEGCAPKADAVPSGASGVKTGVEIGSLRGGPLEGAVYLAEMPSWSAPLRQQLAAALGSSETTLTELEENRQALAPDRAAVLLEPLLHFTATDGNVQRFLRQALLLRYGSRVGISTQQLSYELRR